MFKTELPRYLGSFQDDILVLWETKNLKTFAKNMAYLDITVRGQITSSWLLSNCCQQERICHEIVLSNEQLMFQGYWCINIYNVHNSVS